MIKGIILDLDGLISDTERLHMKAYIQAFQDLGHKLSPDLYASWWIKDGLGLVKYLESHQVQAHIDDIRRLKAHYYDIYMEEDLRPMPHALEFVKYFHKKLPMAVASASPRDNVDRVLKAFDLENMVEFSLSFEDVENSKPHPEIWLKSAQILGLDPGQCIALEDAQKGILAASRALMPSIAVPNIYTRDNDFSQADYLVGDLEEARLLIERLRGEDQ